MTAVIERDAATGRSPRRGRRRRAPKRDDLYRARRRSMFQARIDAAGTPVDHLAACLDYLRHTLRFVRDQDAAWRVAVEVGKAIVRAADGLEEHVQRGGRR